MQNYRVPFEHGEAEFVEKKSRFIGNIFRVVTEQEAQEHIAEIQKKYRDANHNVYAYIIDGGRVMRYSDNGEPQGTAGIPVLEVLKKEEIFDALCVVTRYFGGILLGAGGLTRAYSRGARVAIEQSGTAIMRPYQFAKLQMGYHMVDSVRRLMAECEVAETAAEYGASVCFEICAPAEGFEPFALKLRNLTSNSAILEKTEEKLFAKKE